MQIKEANVYNFGKLQNKEYQFTPGLNVIYGKNEAGKSTLHQFLMAMLFGLDKGRGKKDIYSRYEPWHAPSFYSGTLRFTVGNQPFYLERNFYHREKRELLRNEADGEELSVAYGDLAMLLGGIGKETFGNTFYVPQSGILDGKELTEILNEYLSDAAESGDGGTHVAKALTSLENECKKLNANIRKLKEEKQREERELEIERHLLEQDSMLLRRQIEQEEQELQSGKMLNRQVKEQTVGRQQENKARGWSLVLFATLVAAMVANFAGFLFLDYSAVAFVVTEVVGGILLFGLWKNRTKDCEIPSSIPESWSQTERILENQRELLLEKETRLYNIKERQCELQTAGDEERELVSDVAAMELAMTEIRRISKEYGESLTDELNSEVSRWVSVITEGTYDSVRVDAEGTLKVLVDGKEIPPDVLSLGTLEQFYLTFRIAVGNVVTREEPMPLFLDETFCMYDDERLGQTLQALAQMKQQVLLFTCQKREVELLDKQGITYHLLKME